MNYTSPELVDRKALERVLDSVIRGEVSLQAFGHWIEKVTAAEEYEVDEEDNELVWMVVYWLGDCADDADGCDLATSVTRYRQVLAAAPINRMAETLLYLVGARDRLIHALTSVASGLMSRTQFDALIDEGHPWPDELRQSMRSFPDSAANALLAALKSDDYQAVIRILKLE